MTINIKRKDALGFNKDGYITLIPEEFVTEDGNAMIGSEMIRARYTRWWGWYIPTSLADKGFKVLPWEFIGLASGDLKPEEEIVRVAENIIYAGNAKSDFLGELGDRLDFIVTVIKAIPLEKGSILYIFNDKDENEIVWTTAAKRWEVGTTHHFRATIKDHRTYRNTKQTIITNAREVK